MIHPILAYGEPILKLKASKISLEETNDLAPLINDLWETMYNANGVGIAVPQIGISKAIFVADFSFFKEEENFKEDELINMQQVFINPEIINETGNDSTYPEGCLSIPNISENVIRKEKLKIKGISHVLECGPKFIIFFFHDRKAIFPIFFDTLLQSRIFLKFSGTTPVFSSHLSFQVPHPQQSAPLKKTPPEGTKSTGYW